MDLLQLTRLSNFLGIAATQRPKPKLKDAASIGILGASQVSTYALIWPSRHLPAAHVAAVAARSSSRAHKFAKQYGIPGSYGSYDEMLADPKIRAIYVGLPNGLHGQWARQALEAGKHVLCEKPFGANAAEAREVHSLALKKGLICREAFHYREHPLASRLREIALGSPKDVKHAAQLPTFMVAPNTAGGRGGLLGELTSIDVKVLIPKWVFGGTNIRFLEELAGGAMMDAGTYTVNMMRLITGAEPSVEDAQAVLRPGSKVVDGAMQARISWPSLPGLKGTLHASLQHDGWLPVTELKLDGQRASLECKGFVVPFLGTPLRVMSKPARASSNNLQASYVEFLRQVKQQAGLCLVNDPAFPTSDEAAASTAASMATVPALLGKKPEHAKEIWAGGQPWGWEERVFGQEQQTTYYHQLARFTTDIRVLEGCSTARDVSSVKAACTFDAEDSVANMAVLDACYEAAGLPVRLPTAQWRLQDVCKEHVPS